MTSCTFAGHREFDNIFAVYAAEREIKQLLDYNNAVEFICGDMGAFDRMCETTVRDLRHLYPDKELKIKLVLPFKTKDYEYKPLYYSENYDEVLIPDFLDKLDNKAKIPMRNNFMVESSDFLIACVERSSGGAARTLNHAIEKHKHYINVANTPPLREYSFNEVLGLFIKYKRRCMGIAIDGIASTTRLGYDYIYNLELGERAATVDAVRAVAKALDMSTSQLIASAEVYYNACSALFKKNAQRK